MNCEGLDVSSAQAALGIHPEYIIVPGGRRFVYVKANEGEGPADSQFHKHLEKFNAAGLLTGCYHFARPDADPIDDMTALFKVTAAEYFDLRIALDMEIMNDRTPDQVLDWVGRAASRVQELDARGPVLYTYVSYWRNLWKNASKLYRDAFETAIHEYDILLWVSQFGVDQPAQLEPWTEVHMHQYAGNTFLWVDGLSYPVAAPYKQPGDTVLVDGIARKATKYAARPGSCPGVPGEVDCNRFAGSYDDLKRAHGLKVAEPTLPG